MPGLPTPPQTDDEALNRWLWDVRRLLHSEGIVEYIHGWLADDVQTVMLGKLPMNSYVMSVRVHVTEAFDSDGTDQIQVGWTADNDALLTYIDASSTGIKGEDMGALGGLMGVNDGFNSAEQTVNAYYVNGGTEPSTGKALVIVEFARVKTQIA